MKGRAVVTDDNAKSRPWKDLTTATVLDSLQDYRDRGGELPVFPSGPVTLRLRFVLKRPKGHYGSGKNVNVLKLNAPYFHTSKPDALKLARGVEDALTGVLYRDDSQTIPICWKVYGDVECVEVWAEQATPGIETVILSVVV